MRIAETVTFGGSGLDRAAHLRGKEDVLADLRSDATARYLPVWRGKMPVIGEKGEDLVWLTPKDDLVRAALADGKGAIFLGLDETGPRFAFDMSGWVPDDFDAEMARAFFDPNEYAHPGMIAGSRFAELRGVMSRLSPRDGEMAVIARGLLEWHRSHSFCANCGTGSTMVNAGWQRLCPSCGRMHFPRTDPVVIMLITHGNSLLLGRSPGWPEKMYSLLAGFVEPGETIEAAVRREVYEETAIRVGPVGYLASQPWPFPASLMIGCEGQATSSEITIDPVEIEDALWITREELLDVQARLSDRVLPARRGSIAHFLITNWMADNLG